MNLLLAKFKREFPFWNIRAFTLDDFNSYCRRKGIKIHEMPMKTAAMFGVSRSKPNIYLDTKTQGIARLHAALHELGHYLLHTPPYETVTYYYRLKPNTREEIEADAFAIVALIPAGLMKKLLSSDEYSIEYGMSAALLRERCQLYMRYGI